MLIYIFGVCVCVSETALDAAFEFHNQLLVPSTWKTEVKEESSSSEDDEDDEEEEQEQDANGEEEEVVAQFHTLITSRLQKNRTEKCSLCHRRKWNRSLRKERIFYSSSTSSWRTEVSPAVNVQNIFEYSVVVIS